MKNNIEFKNLARLYKKYKANTLIELIHYLYDKKNIDCETLLLVNELEQVNSKRYKCLNRLIRRGDDKIHKKSKNNSN